LSTEINEVIEDEIEKKIVSAEEEKQTLFEAISSLEIKLDSVIDIYCSTGKCYLWDPDAVYILRTKCRIIGEAVGSLPSYHQQNIFRSLPFIYSNEQITFCLQKGWIRLIDDDKKYPEPSADEVQSYFEKRNKDLAIQKQAAREERLAKILEHKKRKHSENISEIELDKEDLADKGDDGFLGSITIITQSKIPKREKLDITAYWNFPITRREQMQAKIYADLWNRGYFISTASKFGGDYLLYPGDPLRFHAHFVVVIVDYKELLPMHEIISIGRLAVTVKKSPLLASLNADNMPIYFTIDWQGVT